MLKKMRTLRQLSFIGIYILCNKLLVLLVMASFAKKDRAASKYKCKYGHLYFRFQNSGRHTRLSKFKFVFEQFFPPQRNFIRIFHLATTTRVSGIQMGEETPADSE